MKFSIFQVSRKGGRKVNEDRMGYCYTRKSGIFLLADGMGGHPQGEVAAQLALETIFAMYQKEAKAEIVDVGAFLNSAVMLAHRQILRYSTEKGMSDAPRTTIVAVLVQDGCVSWIHCGDSRFYLVRQGELLVRTLDHSFLEQHRSSSGSFKSPERRINRNVLFTCLGSPIKPVVELSGPLALKTGDRLMLCSDGLWGSLSDADIVFQLTHKPVVQAVPELVEKALRQGGVNSDNVTCIALEWETPDGFESSEGSVFTDTVSEGAFASTFQADATGTAFEEMDEAAIERSIAEINETIRRMATDKS